MIDALLDVDIFRVFDTDASRAREFATEMSPQVDAEIVVSDTPEAVVPSDATITVTNSKTPVLRESWLDDSEFIIALGSYQELPDETVLNTDHIVVDHTEQCLQRGTLSDLAARNELTRSDVDATIGEVLTDEYEQPVQEDDRVVFVPIGLGSLDIAIAESIHANRSDSGSIREFNFD